MQTEEGLKPIEEIKVGDKVLAYDEQTGKQDYKTLLHLFRNESKDWVKVTVNGAEIESTPGHKYFLPKIKKWVSAEELKVGTKVLLSDGSYGIVEAVKAIHYDKPETTYNFEVADFHTYYVGTGVLVHNIGCGYHSETIFEHENIGRYKDVSMHLERGGSGKVNLHIHGAGDKFIYNGITYISYAGKVVPNVIGNSQAVATGFNKALIFAKKMGWLFP